jgi:hypothetical protein
MIVKSYPIGWLLFINDNDIVSLELFKLFLLKQRTRFSQITNNFLREEAVLSKGVLG